MRAVILVAALLISSAISPINLAKDKAFSVLFLVVFFLIWDAIELILKMQRKS